MPGKHVKEAAPLRRDAPRAGVVARPDGSRTVLVDMEGGGIFVLNETGARVWNGLARAGRDPGARRGYGASAPEVRADCERLVRELRDAALVEPRS